MLLCHLIILQSVSIKMKITILILLLLVTLIQSFKQESIDLSIDFEGQETITDPGTTENDVTTTEIPDEPSSTKPPDQCPEGTNPNCPDLFANQNDCHSFYQCSNGIFYRKDCAANLVFSPEKCYCDYQENVDDNTCQQVELFKTIKRLKRSDESFRRIKKDKKLSRIILLLIENYD